MAVSRNLAMNTPRRCIGRGLWLHLCFLVIYPTCRPLLACGQCKAWHNKTEAAVFGTAMGTISIVHEYRGCCSMSRVDR